MTNPSSIEPARYLQAGTGANERRIAFLAVAGNRPTIVWLGGYRSDMRGTKAERLSGFAASKGCAFVRFDYAGHGESSTRFEDGTLSRWREDAETVIDALAPEGPLVLVGSSMGAWIALLLAARLRDRLAGMLLLAPAPDFTERLLLPALSERQKSDLETKGFATEASDYSDEPNIYTKALIEDGRRNLVMTAPITVSCPVHIVQGMADPDVPVAHALDLAALLPSAGLSLTLVPGGDHRLSRDEDLVRMENALHDLLDDARRR